MAFLSWLFARAPRMETPAPPMARETIVIPVNDPPDLMPEPAGPDLTQAEDMPLENLFCQIEYTDAKGEFSRRPVTFIALTRKFGVPAIQAICHHRRAMRCFRTDRISAVITADGEVFDGHQFLAGTLGLDLTPGEGGSPAAPRIRRDTAPGPRDLRELLMAPLTVLAACGKADGHYHIEEIDRIMSWAESEAIHLHRAGLLPRMPTIEDADALGRTIAAMRPQARTIRRHMLAVLTMAPEAQLRFRKALQRVIAADGILHPAEQAFVAELDALAKEAARQPGRLATFLGEEG